MEVVTCGVERLEPPIVEDETPPGARWMRA
jgi:hypothetical protein